MVVETEMIERGGLCALSGTKWGRGPTLCVTKQHCSNRPLRFGSRGGRGGWLRAPRRWNATGRVWSLNAGWLGLKAGTLPALLGPCHRQSPSRPRPQSFILLAQWSWLPPPGFPKLRLELSPPPPPVPGIELEVSPPHHPGSPELWLEFPPPTPSCPRNWLELSSPSPN